MNKTESAIMRAKTPDEYLDASLASKLAPALKAKLARSWMRISGYTVDDIIKARNRHPFWKKIRSQDAAESAKKRMEEHDYSQGVEIAWTPALVGEFLGMNGKDESGHYKNKDWEIAKRFRTSIPSIQYMRRKFALSGRTLGGNAPKSEIVAFLCGIKYEDRKAGAMNAAVSKLALKPLKERSVHGIGKTGFLSDDRRSTISRGAGGTGYGTKNLGRAEGRGKRQDDIPSGGRIVRGEERSSPRNGLSGKNGSTGKLFLKTARMELSGRSFSKEGFSVRPGKSGENRKPDERKTPGDRRPYGDGSKRTNSPEKRTPGRQESGYPDRSSVHGK